jgi:hypothetical protein
VLAAALAGARLEVVRLAEGVVALLPPRGGSGASSASAARARDSFFREELSVLRHVHPKLHGTRDDRVVGP